MPHDQATKYKWGGAWEHTTPTTMPTQVSNQQKHAICFQQHHSSLSTIFEVARTIEKRQTRYEAEAIQKLYNPEQEANAKESPMSRSIDTNLDKMSQFLGLSENHRCSRAAYALKHFGSLQNDIYMKCISMKFNRELNKHKISQTLVCCMG